jgi:serine protease Do
MKDKKIVVENVMPADMRDKSYKDVDLKESDVIMMVNGKKVSSIKDCEDIYNNVKTGEEFKMGINRNDKMFIAGFKKANPEELQSAGKMIIKKDGKKGEFNILPEFGILLSGSNGKVTVKEVIKEIPGTEAKDVKAGDIILKINDKVVGNLDDLTKEYDNVKTGKKIELVLKRNSKEITVTAEKKEGEGKVIIKKSK